jgi:glycosyltransferase 2 family protein
LLLLTGLVLTLGLSPQLLGSWTEGQAPAAWIALVLVGMSILIVGFPAIAPRVKVLAERVAGRQVAWPAPPARALGLYSAALLIPWLVYGVAFHLFAVALLGPDAPRPIVSIAAFVGSYVAGIIAVFAPGGLVVREVALTAALTPVIGGQHALFLAVISRLWLVAVELVTALAVVAVHRLSASRETVEA